MTEGEKYYVNKVIIRGNLITQDHVIRRSVTILPGDLANTDALEETKRRLREHRVLLRPRAAAGKARRCASASWTAPQPGKTTTSSSRSSRAAWANFSVGAGFSSTLGLIGNITLTHRNFDATAFPTSWAEIMRGEAFAGDGQQLTISVSPGTILNDYRLSWTNPSVWDSPYSVGFDLYLHDIRSGRTSTRSSASAAASPSAGGSSRT